MNSYEPIAERDTAEVPNRVRLPQLHLGAPTVHGPLTIFPIWTDAALPGHRTYTTATTRGADVSELDSGPSVGQVQVKHDGHRPRILFGGMLLEAGWQHRVLIDDVAVGRGKRELVSVACVEQHRWGGNRNQRPGTRLAPLAVRGATLGVTPEAAAWTGPAGERRADQGDVWRRVARYERMVASSATSSLVDVVGHLDEPVKSLTSSVRPLPGQRGVLIGIGGQPALLEVFDHPDTLAEQWDAILGSVWADVHSAEPVPTPGYVARDFVRQVGEADLEPMRDAGVGRGVAIEDQSRFSGRGLLLADTLVHASVLNSQHELVLAV